jgi:hypothetical protein
MKHLTEIEFVELLEERLDSESLRHLDACPACREQAQALAAALRSARDDRMPEPSPLFWQHLSARVAGAIRDQPAPSRWRSLLSQDRWRLAFGSAVLALVAALTWQLFPARDRSPSITPLSPPAGQIPADSGDAPPAEEFVDAWDALETVAQDLSGRTRNEIGIAFSLGSARQRRRSHG